MSSRKVYLAGAIWASADPVTWREQLTKLLPSGWKASNPLLLEISSLSCFELVRMDLAEILHCDAVIARALEPSWGTAMEIKHARSHSIPVIGWVANANASQSPWLEAHCVWFVDSIEAAVEQLKSL